MNIIDYISWRGDIRFSEAPFNEIDNLILSELSYLNLEGIIPGDNTYRSSLEHVYRMYTYKGYDQSYLINDPILILEKAAKCERFRDVKLGRFIQKTDSDKCVQFAAVTFHLGNGYSFIGFSGTDNSITGWREDFNLSFLESTKGQQEAVRYINTEAAENKDRFIIGGHSKGGNSAIYAAAFCDRKIREERIEKIYSNDGPGFNEEIYESEEYLSILPKTVKIIPESSLVGILLSSRLDAKIVKSDAKGLNQHNPYTWEVEGTSFVEADKRSFYSVFMDETLNRWISNLGYEEREAFVGAIFDTIESSGVENFRDLNDNKFVSYNAIIRAASKVDSKIVISLIKSLKEIASAGKDVLWNETRKSFEKR